MTKKLLTRRQIIKDATKASIGSALLLNSPLDLFGQGEGKTKVILIRDENVLGSDNNAKPEILQKMLDKAVLNLTGVSDIKAAWKKIIKPGDIVGVKSNVWGHLPTPPALEKGIKKRVMEAGVSEKNISISDRGVLGDPVFRKSTALINVRPLRTHAWSGVGSLIKNYIMFSNRPASYHPDSCADLAKLFELPAVKGKTRLNILVMLTPLFHGVGPHHFNKKYIWPYKGLIVSFDPVAADAVGLQILQAKRKEFFGEDKPLNPPAKHIYLADTRHHLGTADPKKIDLVKMGFKENIFI
ncbi:MAG: DUF362 domain-containing protein [Bacteroidales bacterium]|nr:MAG: DUF362 domain-containing protein [Bacteroidales bacterium]